MSCTKKDCKFKATGSSRLDICDYIGHTGKSRGCPADNCNKYEPLVTKRKPNQIFIEPAYENWIG